MRLLRCCSVAVSVLALVLAGSPRRVAAIDCFAATVFQRGQSGAFDFSTATIASDCTELKLNGAGIGDVGATALATALMGNSHPQLVKLDLRSNGIGDAGATAVATQLETHGTVATLELADNAVGDDGAVAVARALKINAAFTTLSLWGNSFGVVGMGAVERALHL